MGVEIFSIGDKRVTFCNVFRGSIKIIRKRQLQFFGHLSREDGIKKQILSGKICGTKSRGRQRTKYIDSLNNFVTRKESPYNELTRRTQN